jgi:hypothetical protein
MLLMGIAQVVTQVLSYAGKGIALFPYSANWGQFMPDELIVWMPICFGATSEALPIPQRKSPASILFQEASN